MRKSTLMYTVLVFLAIGVTGNAWALVGLPTADISGNAATTATAVGVNGELTLVNALISKVNYLDGTSTSMNGPDESIIGAIVTISGATRTGNYTFSDAVITVGDGSFNYLSATLSNIVFVTDGYQWFLNPGLDVNDPATLNLSNIVLSTDIDHPSRYIDELATVKGTGDAMGMSIILAIINGDISVNSSSDIASGIIDGVPTDGGGGVIEAPSGARSVGFWKNHDAERDAFISGAVASSSVFSTATELNYFLSKIGKKTMEEKAKQQLAALLLNISASLDPATSLAQGEIDILLLINPAGGSTIGDALTEIENAILTGASLEDAKDLGDEINNRESSSGQ